MIPYGFVQMALFLQMVLWFGIYHSKRVRIAEKLDSSFYFIGFVAIYVVLTTGFTVGYFTPNILSQYILMVMGAVKAYQIRFNLKHSLCLGFLTVYLNSFYWEIPYHILEVIVSGPLAYNLGWWFVRIPQWLRIVPAFWLIRNFEFPNRHYLSLGLVVNTLLTWFRYTYKIPGLWMHPIHRGISLVILGAVILTGTPKYEIGE